MMIKLMHKPKLYGQCDHFIGFGGSGILTYYSMAILPFLNDVSFLTDAINGYPTRKYKVTQYFGW